MSRRLVVKSDGCLRIGGASVGADEMVALARQHVTEVYYAHSEVSRSEGQSSYAGAPGTGADCRWMFALPPQILAMDDERECGFSAISAINSGIAKPP